MKISLHVILFNFLIFTFYSLNAQNIIQDTLEISFDKIATDEMSVVIDTVIDQREQQLNRIGDYEINKYWVIPVDLSIQTKKPLSALLKNIFPNQFSLTENHLKLIIDKFEVNKNSNSLFYPHYRLNSFIQVYELDDSEGYRFVGNLVYDNTVREKLFSDELKEGFEAVVKDWQNDFVQDLIIISNDSFVHQNLLPENYRIDTTEVSETNFYGGIDYIYGLNDYLFDGEIYFSNREAGNWFYRNGYGLRYRNSDTFESIEFGLSVDYMNYRFNHQFLLKLKSQLLFGVNNWLDYKTNEHEFYDAFIGDLSLSQSIEYNPLDKSFLIFGLGVAENLYYIYSKGLRVDAGLLVHIGIKL